MRPRQDYTHHVMLNGRVSTRWSLMCQYSALTLLRDSHPLPTRQSKALNTDRRLFFSLPYFSFCTSAFFTCHQLSLYNYLLVPRKPCNQSNHSAVKTTNLFLVHPCMHACMHITAKTIYTWLKWALSVLALWSLMGWWMFWISLIIDSPVQWTVKLQ